METPHPRTPPATLTDFYHSQVNIILFLLQLRNGLHVHDIAVVHLEVVPNRKKANKICFQQTHIKARSRLLGSLFSTFKRAKQQQKKFFLLDRVAT